MPKDTLGFETDDLGFEPAPSSATDELGFEAAKDNLGFDVEPTPILKSAIEPIIKPIKRLADFSASPETRRSAVNVVTGIPASIIEQPVKAGQEAMNVLTGQPVRQFLQPPDAKSAFHPTIVGIVKEALSANPEKAIAEQVPEVERMYKERYGQGLPSALKKDIFGVMADVAMVAGGVAGVRGMTKPKAGTPKIAPGAPKPSISEPIPVFKGAKGGEKGLKDITQGEVVYRGTVGKGEIENIINGKSNYIENEQGGMWTGDVQDAMKYSKRFSLDLGMNSIKSKGDTPYLLEGIKGKDGVITPVSAKNLSTGEVVSFKKREAMEKAREVNPLESEALKYKTAEEFVNSKKIPKPILSGKELSDIARTSDNMGYTLSLQEKKEMFTDIVNSLRKRGIKSVDAYHITNAGEGVFKKEGIKGSKLDYIGGKGGNLRDNSTYIFLDPDDIKLGQDYIQTESGGNPVVHVKIPIDELHKLNWDSNFNLTAGTYSAQRFLGDIPKDWIQDIYKPKSQLTEIWNKAHGAIPEFKNTPEAIAYGESIKGNKEKVIELMNKRAEIERNSQQVISDPMSTPEQLRQAKYNITGNQFYREAAQAATDTVSEQGVVDWLSKGPKPSKERGFVTTVKESKNTVPEVASKVEGQYVPRSTDVLSTKARQLIETNIDEARKLALEGTDDKSVASAMELIHHYQNVGDYGAAIDMVNQVAPKLTELGRAIQAATLYNRLSPTGVLRYAQGLIRKAQIKMPGKKIANLTPEEARAFRMEAEGIQKMPEGVDKAIAMNGLLDKIYSKIPSTFSEKAISLWKAGLLSGPKTHIVNAMSNAVHFGSEMLKDLPAAGVDSVASLFTGKRSMAFTGKRTIFGVKEGLSKGWRYLKTGFDERNAAAKYDMKRVNFGQSELSKALRFYEQGVFRLLGASDQPFYYGAKARSIYEQALVSAKNSGLKGIERQKAIQDMIANPTDEMLRNAVNDAQIAVFQNKTRLGQAAVSATRELGFIGELIAPFKTTPAAIAGQIINYSPVGVAKTIIAQIARGKFGQREFSQAAGRSITGTGLFAIGAALYKAGRISLNAPTSEKERAQWELEGRTVQSVLIDGEWRRLGSLGPIGLTMAVGGYYQQALNESGSPTKALAAATTGTMRTMADQTFLQGVSNMLGAINDPLRYGERFITGMVGSVVPRIVGTTAQAIDPYARRVRENNLLKGSASAIQGNIPFARQGLAVRRNTLGKPMESDSAMGTMFDPLRSSKDTSKSDPVVQELSRLNTVGLNATPARITNNIKIEDKKISLTADQTDELQSEIGDDIYDSMNAIMKANWYDNYSDEVKSKTISNAISDIVKARTVKYAIDNNLVSPDEIKKTLVDLRKSRGERYFMKRGETRAENIRPFRRAITERKSSRIQNRKPDARALDYLENMK